VFAGVVDCLAGARERSGFPIAAEAAMADREQRRPGANGSFLKFAGRCYSMQKI